jgi:hydroxymethylpyrimidine kinase/phosphomethylpyrimidine kinase
MTSTTAPRALTIAGFDPSGGAGLLAGVRTFAAFGLQAHGVITSITFQNEHKVVGAEHQSAASVRAQVEPLLSGAKIVSATTGMLPTREVVEEVARLFREEKLPRPVVDPVINASSGYRLMAEDAVEVFVDKLLPLAAVVTPNVPEAEMLAGTKIETETDMRNAAAFIRRLGAKAVLIKGGHLTETDGEAIDVLDNEGNVMVYRKPMIAGAKLHGSGCVLAAAIAAGLGKEMTLEDSVSLAKRFLYEKLLDTSRNKQD